MRIFYTIAILFMLTGAAYCFSCKKGIVCAGYHKHMDKKESCAASCMENFCDHSKVIGDPCKIHKDHHTTVTGFTCKCS